MKISSKGKHSHWVTGTTSLSSSSKLSINVPPNVIVIGFLPAHKVNPMADLSVIHGGQNTVMNACLAGTPIVGMGTHPEQEANLEACVRKGFALRLNRWRAKASDVLTAIDKLQHDPKAKENVLEFQKQLRVREKISSHGEG